MRLGSITLLPEFNLPIPEIPGYKAAIENIAPGITQQAATLQQPGDDWFTSIARAMQTVFMADAQRRLLNIQLERARAGQPPLDSSQYGMGVSVGLGADTQKTILYAILGIGAMLILPKLLRR